MTTAEPAPIWYEDLAAIEEDFEEVDTESIRQQYELSKPAYAKRNDVVSKIDNFWPLVLEQAPMEIAQFIQPQDSDILNSHLKNVTVLRPELDDKGRSGNPRSVQFKLDFSPNEYFSDTVLTKTFHYRRTSDGWTGLVSEPTKIQWKKGKDLTEGLNDAALALWEARKKVGDFAAKGLPEYTALAKKVENLNAGSTSFFTWFGFVSSRRYVGAEESEAAVKEHQQRKEARRRGDAAVSAGDDEKDMDVDDEAESDQAVEVHEAGEEMATAFAEDLWPNAIKYFTQAQELGELSDPEFEEGDMDEDDEDDEPIDIRSLVQGKEKGRSRDSSGGGPPAKKARKQV